MSEADGVLGCIAEALNGVGPDSTMDWTPEAEAVIAALKASRYAVVELPRQCKVPDEWAGSLGAWSTTSAVEPVSAWPKRYVVTPDDHWLNIEDARSLAAALLAAADVAEAGA